jgi:hypothetical protein
VCVCVCVCVCVLCRLYMMGLPPLVQFSVVSVRYIYIYTHKHTHEPVELACVSE